MSSNEDETLGAPSGVSDDEVLAAMPEPEDETEAPTEEDYDFGAFVEGVRPTRRSVVLYGRGDLRASYDELSDAIQIGEAAGKDMGEQRALLEEAADELLGSGRKVVVEARSTDWVQQFFKDAKKRGINPEAKGLSDGQRLEQTRKLILEQIAAQIVYPRKGVSADALAKLQSVNEVEIDKLYRAVRDANAKPAVTADFLQARSGTRRSGSA